MVVNFHRILAYLIEATTIYATVLVTTSNLVTIHSNAVCIKNNDLMDCVL